MNINFDYSSVRGSTELHNKFKNEVIIHLSKVFMNEAIVIPYDVGLARAFSQPDKVVRYGLVGVPDIICFVKNSYVLFDTKTGKNTLTKEQKSLAQRFREISQTEKVYKLNTVYDAEKIVRALL